MFQQRKQLEHKERKCGPVRNVFLKQKSTLERNMKKRKWKKKKKKRDYNEK